MRLLILFVVLGSLILIGCEKKEAPQSERPAEQEKQLPAAADSSVAERLVYYTCPMEEHKHIHSARPGKCPECNMDLVAAVVTSEEHMEFYGCPMEAHSHVRSEKPGTCAECGMTLKPMRLDKKRKS